MKILITIIYSVALMASDAVIAKQIAGNGELFLGGTGISHGTGSGSETSNGFNDTSAGVTAQVGYFLNKSIEVGLRQDVTINDSKDQGLTYQGTSRVFTDFHLDLNNFQPFVGVSAGGIYGSQVKERFVVGPEVGLKYFVFPKTFILAQGSYLFQVDDNIEDGAAIYTLGIGFDF